MSRMCIDYDSNISGRNLKNIPFRKLRCCVELFFACQPCLNIFQETLLRKAVNRSATYLLQLTQNVQKIILQAVEFTTVISFYLKVDIFSCVQILKFIHSAKRFPFKICGHLCLALLSTMYFSTRASTYLSMAFQTFGTPFLVILLMVHDFRLFY